MEKHAEQLVGFPLQPAELVVAEHALAHPGRHVLVIRQPDAGLLGAEVHDHGAQADVRGRLLLGAKAGGKLIAGILDPGPQDGRQLAPGDGTEQLAPLRLAIAARCKNACLCWGQKQPPIMPGLRARRKSSSRTLA